MMNRFASITALIVGSALRQEMTSPAQAERPESCSDRGAPAARAGGEGQPSS